MEAAAAALWEAASVKLREELGWVRTHPWLEAIRPRSVERGVVRLEVGSAEQRARALQHSEAIKAALVAVAGRPVRLRVRLERGRAEPPPRRRRAEPAPDGLHLEEERVNPRQLLSGFLSGPSNRVPLAFARQAVEEPGTWHPLVFYGESGCGKTHLLHGIVNGYRRRHPARRAVYASSERFTSQFVQAMRRRQTAPFRRLYREVDLLAVDDLQGLAGRRGTELELVRTLDALQLSGGQVVLACDAPPKQIADLERGLEGRVLGGQVVKLQTPDRDTRLAIVRARTAASRLELSPAVVDLLASKFEMSVRELLCALTRLEAQQRHLHRSLDVPAVRRILRDLVLHRLEVASPERVSAFVSERMETPVEAIRGRSRKPPVVRARQVAIGLVRELTPLTLKETGAFFGGRSCASVHFAQERARKLLEDDVQAQEVWTAAARRFERPAR